MEFKILDSLKNILKEKGEGKLESIFAFGIFEGDENRFLQDKNLKEFDFIYKRLEQINFKAKKGKSTIIEYPIYSTVCGIGKKSKFDYDSIRYFASISSKISETNRTKEIILIIPELSGEYYTKSGLFYLSAAIAEGVELGLYKFKKYMTKDSEKNNNEITGPKVVRVYFSGLKITEELIDSAKDGLDFGQKTSLATNFTRDLVNEPGNVVTPAYLANIAEEIAKQKNMECEIFDEVEIIKKGMNAFYGVGQGSKNPPRFIHLIYKPKNKSKNTKIKRIIIVGKGVTFDSGGLSLKPSDFMTTMKSDKSGACAVLGIMKYINEFDVNLEVHGIIAACENMPDGGSQRPDDIVKTLNGKTVEIENTDAEGRLTLADALSFASNIGADEIIDLATLTGACVVALGEYTSGVMGNDKELIGNIISTSRISGEKMWELPFDDDMREKLLSSVADIKNLGGKYGGAVTAGMFLEEFVSDKIKWCHIDIAGPSFTKVGFSYNPKGATGVGARTLLYYLIQHKI